MPSPRSLRAKEDWISAITTDTRPLLDKYVCFRFQSFDESQREVIDQKRPRQTHHDPVVKHPKFVVSSHRQGIHCSEHVSKFSGCLLLLLLFTEDSENLSAQMFERLIRNESNFSRR